jgi:hypothetical protein
LLWRGDWDRHGRRTFRVLRGYILTKEGMSRQDPKLEESEDRKPIISTGGIREATGVQPATGGSGFES